MDAAAAEIGFHVGHELGGNFEAPQGRGLVGFARIGVNGGHLGLGSQRTTECGDCLLPMQTASFLNSNTQKHSSMNCPACATELQEQWVACPLCGVRVHSECACGNKLDPSWKVCPVCTRPVDQEAPANSQRGAIEIPAERCFSIYLAAHKAFFSVFDEPFQRLAKAGAASELLKLVSQQSLRSTLTNAISDLCASYLSQPELNASKIAPIDSTQYATELHPHFSNIQTAEQALVERNIPDGEWASLCRIAKSTLADSTVMTAGAVVPILGHAIGGLWTGHQMAKKDNKALEAFLEAIQGFKTQLEDVFAGCYAQLIERSRGEAVEFSVDVREIVQSLEALGALSSAVESAKSQAELKQITNQIEGFITKHAFLAEARVIFASALLNLDRFEEADHEAYAAYGIDNDNQAAVVLMLRARVAMERWDDAAQTASFAAEHGKDDLAICECIGNAIKHVPSQRLFESAINVVAPKLQQAGNPLGFLLEARLSAASGHKQRCEELLHHILSNTPLDLNDVFLLRNDPELAEVIGSNFKGILIGPPSHLRIAQAVLPPADSLSFEIIPAAKKSAAKDSFVKLRKKEQLICYCDTTAFGGGKDGFALTDSRILWHELWKEAVAVEYANIHAFEIRGDENLEQLVVTTKNGSELGYEGAQPEALLGICNFLTLLAAAELPR